MSLPRALGQWHRHAAKGVRQSMRTQSSEFPKGTHFIWNKMWGRLSPRALLETMEILAIRN